jgi:hypothetical protein
MFRKIDLSENILFFSQKISNKFCMKEMENSKIMTFWIANKSIPFLNKRFRTLIKFEYENSLKSKNSIVTFMFSSNSGLYILEPVYSVKTGKNKQLKKRKKDVTKHSFGSDFSKIHWKKMFSFLYRFEFFFVQKLWFVQCSKN